MDDAAAATPQGVCGEGGLDGRAGGGGKFISEARSYRHRRRQAATLPPSLRQDRGVGRR